MVAAAATPACCKKRLIDNKFKLAISHCRVRNSRNAGVLMKALQNAINEAAIP